MHSLSLQMSRALSATHQVDPELNKWLRHCVQMRMPPDDIVSAMLHTGRSPEFCAMLVRLAHDGLFLTPHADERFVRRSPQGTPDAKHAVDHFLDLGDRQARVLMSMDSLRVTLYEGFLSDDECEHLKGCVDGRMQRSMVVGENFSNRESYVRTSNGAFIDVGSTPTVKTIETRIAKLTGVPINHGECLQVLHYKNTEEYQPHFDFFEPQNEQEARMMAAPGNRTSTLLMYLSDVEEGGSTYFPQMKLAIHPKKGSALLFSYLDTEGVMDMRTEHAGLPVTKGEKWVATKWLRERPISQPPVSQWKTDDEGKMGPGMSDVMPGPVLLDPSATIIPFQVPNPPAM